MFRCETNIHLRETNNHLYVSYILGSSVQSLPSRIVEGVTVEVNFSLFFFLFYDVYSVLPLSYTNTFSLPMGREPMEVPRSHGRGATKNLGGLVRVKTGLVKMRSPIEVSANRPPTGGVTWRSDVVPHPTGRWPVPAVTEELFCLPVLSCDLHYISCYSKFISVTYISVKFMVLYELFTNFYTLSSDLGVVTDDSDEL